MEQAQEGPVITMANSAPEATETEHASQLTYALAQIGEFQELIRFADTKAGGAITVVSGLLALLLPTFGSVNAALTSSISAWQFWNAILVLLLSVGFFLAFMSVLYHAFLTFLPRMEEREHTATIAFFLDCHNMGEDAFVQKVKTMSQEDLLDHLLREVFLLSEILVLKFMAQKRCFKAVRIALFLWSVAQIGILALN